MDFAPHEGTDAWKIMLKRAGMMLPAMERLAEDYPGKPDVDSEPPILPVFPNLTEVLNIAACDSRAVIALVTPEEDADQLERGLRTLAFEDRIAGRAHIVRMTRDEWASAIADELLDAGDNGNRAGVFVIGPDAYGRHGTVLAQAPGSANVDQLRAMLHHGLQEFSESFKKLDRSAHILEGKRNGVTWAKYKPEGWEKYIVEGGSCGPAPEPCSTAKPGIE